MGLVTKKTRSSKYLFLSSFCSDDNQSCRYFHVAVSVRQPDRVFARIFGLNPTDLENANIVTFESPESVVVHDGLIVMVPGGRWLGHARRGALKPDCGAQVDGAVVGNREEPGGCVPSGRRRRLWRSTYCATYTTTSRKEIQKKELDPMKAQRSIEISIPATVTRRPFCLLVTWLDHGNKMAASWRDNSTIDVRKNIDRVIFEMKKSEAVDTHADREGLLGESLNISTPRWEKGFQWQSSRHKKFIPSPLSLTKKAHLVTRVLTVCRMWCGIASCTWRQCKK